MNVRRPTATATLLYIAGCAPARDSVTRPAGPEASDIDGLWRLSLWTGTAVWVAVMVLMAMVLLHSLVRRRGEHEPHAGGQPRGHGQGVARTEPVARRLLWIGGVAVPAVILLVLLFASGRVSTSTAHLEADDQLVIEVVGHMFWWEVRYPQLDVITANEIHVPVGQPVLLHLTSQDVIHSFWIPSLHGKVDMIPGQVNRLRFTAGEAGTYRGNCAEFCGIAHAQMVAHVVAQPRSDFATWADRHRAAAPGPTDAGTTEGRQVFLDAGCASCHAVRGLEGGARVGPDLTGVAQRRRLAGGVVDNTRDNRARLISEPWEVKPGIRMPPTELSDEELGALLDYLETLG